MTMVEEMIISGFISKIVSDVVDIPENPIRKAIKDADKKRRDKNQSIETRIYQVTVDAIKEFTKREYKGQDVLYDAAESIIRGFKNSNNNVEAVRVGLKMLVSQVTSETCEDFLKTLYYEICIDRNDILYKQITLSQGEQTLETMREGFDVGNKNDEETHKKLYHVIEGINSINEKIDGIENDKVRHYKMPIKNRADEYAEKWDKNVFLNDFNKRDKNPGVNIKLKDIYLEKHLPHYVWKMNDEISDDLKELLSEYIVNNDGRTMLLILGQPGIGKSTLITWIMANLVEEKDEIFVYQFASDLRKVNWQGEDILNDIFKTLNLEYDDLENKVLILDGFDEICINGDRESVLTKVNQELRNKNFLKKFFLIITCRENYIDQLLLKEIIYITLQVWDENQIKSFCEIYGREIERKKSEMITKKISEIKVKKIVENKEVFGIPLILYMILALDVDIEKSSSIVDIYDQIFSLRGGGIYDRCYDVKHRINEPEIKNHIHQISQRIAFWIFENNADEAFVSQKKFEDICDSVMNETKEKNEDIHRDVLIGNYFKLIKHCEGMGTDELQFVHRSIYEYFVVIHFFESVHELKSKEEVAGELGRLLKKGILSEQILEFIKYKFDSIKGFNLSDSIREIFQIMLKNGMTYYSKKKYKNIIGREMNVFLNMLDIARLWNCNLEGLGNNLVTYLQYNRKDSLDFKEVNLSGTNLEGVNLSGTNLKGIILCSANLKRVGLRGADLEGADLEGANLEGADLSGANLEGADLSVADLREADLSGADLEGAYLGKAYLTGANFGGANLNRTLFDEKQVIKLSEKYELSRSKVYLFKTKEIINYLDYCIKRLRREI